MLTLFLSGLILVDGAIRSMRSIAKDEHFGWAVIGVLGNEVLSVFAAGMLASTVSYAAYVIFDGKVLRIRMRRENASTGPQAL